MEHNVIQDGDITIVELAGNIDIASAASFDETISGLIDNGQTTMLLDFSRVEFIASMGLRMLLKTGQRIESEDGKVHICCINDTVSSVFGMVGLDTIIPVFETKELALEGLA